MLVICVSKCEVSICDVTNDPEIIATVTSGRKTWSVSRVGKRRNRSVPFIYVVSDWLLICFGFCWNYFSKNELCLHFCADLDV